MTAQTDTRKPNKDTIEAHEEALKGECTDCESLEDFWKQMGVKLDQRRDAK